MSGNTHEVVSGLRGCCVCIDAVVGGWRWKSRKRYELHNFCVGHFLAMIYVQVGLHALGGEDRAGGGDK